VGRSPFDVELFHLLLQAGLSRRFHRIRYVVERAIANFKTWRIMHTDYRRPLSTFAQTISVVVGLYFYRMSAE
jgi:hypothetical protein